MLAAPISLFIGAAFLSIIQQPQATIIMNADEAKQRAQRLFKNPEADGSNGSTPGPDYEARSREIRQKIEYLRSLRLAAQAPGKPSNNDDTAG